MSPPNGRCPRCRRSFPWGTTACPICHIGLELFAAVSSALPDTAVFQTGDRLSADIVAGLLAAHGIPCAIRGTSDLVHVVLGQAGTWWVLVPATEESPAQEILDAEIGREDPA